MRVEQDRPNTDDPYPVDDYELASRLSYFCGRVLPMIGSFSLLAMASSWMPLCARKKWLA